MPFAFHDFARTLEKESDSLTPWISKTDASKVPPSQFQRRKGSIYSTPSSRDSQHNNQERDKAYHEKLKEKVRPIYTFPIVSRERPPSISSDVGDGGCRGTRLTALIGLEHLRQEIEMVVISADPLERARLTESCIK